MEAKEKEKQDKILLFIPAYNCAPQIVRVLAKLNSVPPGLFAEILILDNQSKDETNKVAAESLSKVSRHIVKVGRNRNNYGLGGSHKAAFNYADLNGFTHVAVLHGDDQGDVLELLPILEAGRHREVDACLGSRFMKGAKTPGYSRFRVFGNHVFNRLFSAVAQRRVTDLGSGLNVFSRQVFVDADVRHFSDDLRFNCYLLLNLIDKKRSIEFFPITWREEDQISNVRLFSQTVKTLEIVKEYLFQRSKFRTSDHRPNSVASYDFDVIARTNPQEITFED